MIFNGGKEKEYFIENLIMLLNAGMDIISALDVMGGEIKSRTMKEVIRSVKESIMAGEPMDRALEKTHLFKPHVIELIKLGEQSGNLFQNLEVIVVQQKKDRLFESKIRSAMLYPVFILSLASVIGIGVAWWILPNLSSVFSQLHIELPLITKILIKVGAFLKENGIWAIPGGIGGFLVIIYFIFFFRKTRWIGQGIILSTPVINKLIQEVELARIGYVMGTLLHAGVPIIDSLRSLRDTASFEAYRNLYHYFVESLSNGNTFSRSFSLYPKSNKLIPIAIQQMIVAGEQSGKLYDTFLRIGEIFEVRTEEATKNVAVLIEPLLLVIVWLAVLGVALAVIMPIYGLIGGLNTI
ncbi:MAG: Type IV pilus assembly protein tapC [Parcubacteria group bacterium Gr01-1014_18]|nr:MAG: Type IV pilus assembly protein tapC [Parcubacteria group bacterium Greene0416_36]TSC79747.1 MAG: Type IV pilus assembly protein tapC [Parcubacteria group bacterium Gr01-1014_18]TSC97917.1 MAG: Type IV pilus assembly protein tapC [Parcubacteria group bacterium Greene1014_20]TSD06575.1 MAG: Type IV pilus assembly protein tapC [Parcubacteria group bacterium Greene0714_2]